MKKLIPLLIFVFFLTACTPKDSGNKKYEREIFAMDTHIKLTLYGEDCSEAMNKAETEINRINQKYGIANFDVTTIGDDEETQELLKTADEINKSTGGAFDVRVAPLVRIWGFYSSEFGEKNHRIPTESEIKEAMEASQAGVYLDFGAIAKGYCCDKLVEIIKAEGVESAVMSLGGNVAVVGKNPDGNPWTVGVQSPFDESIYATITASDKMIVTSGDYMRYFEKNGKKYHHIINPATGYPAESDLTSVTVIADSGAYADALSTALFVMGMEKAVEYWRTYGDFEMILITKDGKIHHTDGVNIATQHTAEKIKEQ